jgi:hypothetical protein
MQMKQPFHKKKTSQFIRYTEPNQEPAEHQAGKALIRGILHNVGYVCVTNAPKFEYAMPPITNIFKLTKNYTLDCLMYHNLELKLIAVEIHGAYHRKNRIQIADTKWKEESIRQWLLEHDKIECDGKFYPYHSWRFRAFETDDLVGKYKMDDAAILKNLI